MVAVRVAEQNNVYISKPRIGRPSYRLGGVIKNPHASGIFKEESPVGGAEFTSVRAQWSDFYILS